MFDKRFIIVAGKGGVGRTTIAAALGTLLARRGRRTLIAFARSERRLGKLLGCARVDEEIRSIAPDLWAVNMNPRAALREVGMMVLRFRSVYRAVMENRIVRHFLGAVPGLEDYSMLGKAWYHTTEELSGQPKYETVIFDGPATGNLMSMLRIPRVILDAVPAGPLTADARKVHGLLTDPRRTSMWIVTLAEEMPVTEAVDLYRATSADLGIAAQRLVVNMVYPDPLAGVGADAQRCLDAAPPELEPLVAAARTLHRRHAINAQYLARLAGEVPLPRVLVPYLFTPLFTRQALDVVAQHLEAAP